jgi:acetyl-CoA carboxylase biotin carboxyl carrier protein
VAPTRTQEPLLYSLTYQDAAEILRLIRENESVTRFELEFGGIKISVDREAAAPAGRPAAPGAIAARQPSIPATTPAHVPTPEHAPAAASAEDPGLHRIAAPMLGIFFRSPSIGAPPFVQEGDRIKAGDTVGLIEVMKLFTPVVAECAGRVVRIDAADATLVEHGQTLLLIEPSSDA